MKLPVTDKIADNRAGQSLLCQLNSFMRSSESLTLLTSDCSTLRECALQRVVKESRQDAQPLIINAHTGCSTERLLTHLREHWKLLTPVNMSGFRAELDDFLSCYRKKEGQGVLIVTEAQHLPIATQAALVHLMHLQEQKGPALKIILIASPVLKKKLSIFSPSGVAEIALAREEKAFTQWVVQRIVKENYADCKKLPTDIVELAHTVSKGEPEEMRWIVDKWFSAADNAHREKKEPLIVKESILQQKKTSPVESPIPVSQVRSSFWNRRTVMSGLMTLALTAGLATHTLHHRATHKQHFSNWHASLPAKYTIQVLDTGNRMEALQWIAHHPGLANEHVVSEKRGAGMRYHVEFGKFASNKQAADTLMKLQSSHQLTGARVTHH
jgi:hypothetical protein